jgi:hypothetical protein
MRERNPLPENGTEFDRTVVYPQLDRGEHALGDVEFTRRLHEFFGTVQRAARPARVSVAYDHRNDLDLLGIALDAFDTPDSPLRPAFAEIELTTLGKQYTQAIEECFARDASLTARRHHALVDARVNRAAWLTIQSPAESTGNPDSQ